MPKATVDCLGRHLTCAQMVGGFMINHLRIWSLGFSPAELVLYNRMIQTYFP